MLPFKNVNPQYKYPKVSLPECSLAAQTEPENKQEFTDGIQQLIKEKYGSCFICKL